MRTRRQHWRGTVVAVALDWWRGGSSSSLGRGNGGSGKQAPLLRCVRHLGRSDAERDAGSHSGSSRRARQRTSLSFEGAARRRGGAAADQLHGGCRIVLGLVQLWNRCGLGFAQLHDGMGKERGGCMPPLS